MRILSILVLTLVLSASALAQQSLRPGSAAPRFSAPAIDGTVYDLNGLQGKIVVITFWSTKCAICHSEIPKLNRLAERYRGQDVVFLALTMENEAKIESYIRKTPFNFNHLANSFGVVLQYADRDGRGNINMGFPAHFVVDPVGKIELKTSGFNKSAELESKISRLIAEQGDRDPMTASAGK